MITAIKIQDSNYKFKTGENEGEINGLNKVNIFVGQNNSGKSRFMRSIFSNDLFLKDSGFDKTKSFLLKIKNDITSHLESLRLSSNSSFSELVTHLRKAEQDKYYDEQGTCYLNIRQIEKDISALKGQTTTSTDRKNHAEVGNEVDSIFNKIKTVEEVDIESLENNFKNKKVYIPLLRGLKNPEKNSTSDLYRLRTSFDYFNETQNWDTKFDIFTGLSLYEDIKKMLLGNHEERENIRAFEKFLSNNFFNGESVVLIPKHDNDVLDVKIGKKEQRPIYHLGDGIQSIIINTFPIFKYKDENLLLFIEEPELGIHPGMQRILLETLSKGIEGQKGEHQIYFTTHSNHFLDIALDKEISDKVSIYQFKETDNENEKHITNISQNKEILDLLGVRNSSVFLSNCIIWVEGISDRIYIRKFLELYQNKNGPKFEEDKHYSILEYGGGNITHFNFGEGEDDEITVSAINKSNFILADNDGPNADPAKKLRLEKLKTILGEDNIYFDMPEIENIITYEHFHSYFNEYTGINRQIKNPVGNINDFKRDIMDKDIGEIIKNIFVELKPGKTSENFSTGKDISIIGSKSKVAERMIEFFDDYDNLSDSAKQLTEKLYKFIENNNQ